jgi:serine/threonine protein kinase
MNANHLILIISGPEAGRSFVLADGQSLQIGRGQNSDTKINDPYMSRIHCRVSIDGDRAQIIDASGGNLFVDGKPTESAILESGAEFKAGQSTFRYLIGDISDQKTVLPGNAPHQKPATPTTPPPSPKQSEPASARPEDLFGKSFASYRVDSLLAVGSTGLVFKGTDTQKDRTVAIKVLFPDRMSNEEERDRFIRAMKTMLPIRHPNLVRIYNAGKSGPYCWAAMEYVDGENLNQVIDRIGIEGMLDWRQVWRVAVDVASGLDAAAREKIIHRNVTPANILRRKADKVCMLGDLMLAKALEGTLARQVTSPGTMVGSINYMSPERTRDSNIEDTRSDIYGLGATLYALLTGRPPFQGDSTIEIIRKIREEEPVPPTKYQMAIHAPFEAIVLRMISKHPDQRYASPEVLLKELERIGRYQSL